MLRAVRSVAVIAVIAVIFDNAVIAAIAVIGVADVADCGNLEGVSVNDAVGSAWDGLGKVEQASERKTIAVIVYL
jgi:hypothetical protein